LTEWVRWAGPYDLEDARRILRVDAREIGIFDHLLDAEGSRRRLEPPAADRDRKRGDQTAIVYEVELPRLQSEHEIRRPGGFRHRLLGDPSGRCGLRGMRHRGRAGAQSRHEEYRYGRARGRSEQSTKT